MPVALVRPVDGAAGTCDAPHAGMQPNDLPQAMPEILSEWRSRLRPGAHETPRRDERGRAEVALASSLVRVGLSIPEDAGSALVALTVAAATYGRMQYAQALDPDAIVRELGLLRDAIWRLLASSAAMADVGSREFIGRVDGAINIAARAAVRAGLERGQSVWKPRLV